MENTTNRKPWIIIGVVVLVVLAVVVAFFIGRGGRETDSASSSSSPAPASSPAASETSSAQEWGQDSSDLFGRNIKVPINGVGNPLGTVIPRRELECSTENPQKLTIQRTHDMPTVWSQTLGPSVTTKGIPTGYDHTAEAAMMAMWNAMMLYMHGGESQKNALEVVFTGPTAENELASMGEETAPVSQNSLNGVGPAAFRVTSCNEDRVVGDLAMPLPTDEFGNPNKKAWSIFRVSARWEGSDWKVELGEVDQPLEDTVSTLDGWTQWSF